MCLYGLRTIGHVESTLTDLADAPRQPDEGAHEAWVVVDERYAAALDGLSAGAQVVLVTWLDRADREVLAVHPRGEVDRPVTGVFATRSPDRPNPIGLHVAQVLGVVGTRVHLSSLEALHGTPVLDIKPVLTLDR
jgi:tRNA-Thr(GGU) m(6)t(6)A37 methyltransferase TsaA